MHRTVINGDKGLFTAPAINGVNPLLRYYYPYHERMSESWDFTLLETDSELPLNVGHTAARRGDVVTSPPLHGGDLRSARPFEFRVVSPPLEIQSGHTVPHLQVQVSAPT
jgi:hypothetical protein